MVGKVARKLVVVDSALLIRLSAKSVLPVSASVGVAGAKVSMPWVSLADKSALTNALPAASVKVPATKLSATLPLAKPAVGATTTV